MGFFEAGYYCDFETDASDFGQDSCDFCGSGHEAPGRKWCGGAPKKPMGSSKEAPGRLQGGSKEATRRVLGLLHSNYVTYY